MTVARGGAPIPSELRAYLRQPETKPRLAALQGPAPRAFLAGVALNYGVIAISIYACMLSVSSWWLVLVYPLVLLTIGARQHALLILMHDATHYLAARNRTLNEWLGEILTAAPMFVSMQNYRANHLAHHQQLNTNEDPDWIRKIQPEDERDYWIFPAQKRAVHLFFALYKRSIGYLIRSLRDNSKNDPAQRKRSETEHRIVRTRNLLYLATIALLSYTGTWLHFITLWIAPTLLVLPMLMRLRSIAEHFALPHDHPLRESRNIRPGYIERFFLAPHNIGAHLDHHIVASVPVNNLSALHELLMECDYFRSNAHNNDGYLIGGNSLVQDMYRTPSARLPNRVDSRPTLGDAAVA